MSRSFLSASVHWCMLAICLTWVNTTAIACEFNNCVHDCNLYMGWGSGDGTCYGSEEGVFWKTAVACVQASHPGRSWFSDGINVTVDSWESCCVRCLGNQDSGASQEANNWSNYLNSSTTSQHSCDWVA
jgi:hypothetical protein